MIQHPVAQQRPDLQHFSPANPAGRQTLQRLEAAGSNATQSVNPLLVTAGLAALLLMCAAWQLWAGAARSRASVALLLGAAVFVPLLGAAASSASDPAPHGQVAARHLQGAVSALEDMRMPDNALRSRAVQLAQRAESWTTLVAIEAAIGQDHQQLAASETAIAAYNSRLANDPETAELITRDLGVLLGKHDALVAQYQADLGREYDFYVSTAQAPQQRDDVVQAASLTAPEAVTAIAYDINTVQTQLAQEAAIKAAEAAAAAVPAPSFPHGYIPRGRLAFHAPAGGVITQGFGSTDLSLEPPTTYKGVFYPHFHTGLDIAGALDAPVGASAAGVVILATSSLDAHGHLTGYGNYVVIDNGRGFLTLYGHLDKLLVKAGQVVRQGQVIGLLGSTGWSTGPHLHFEIRVKGECVDPAPYIAAQIRH